MKVYSECIPCFFKQVLWIAEKVKLNFREKEKLVNSIKELLSQREVFNQPPPYLAQKIYNLIYKITGVEDIFKEEKIYFTKKALEFYPLLKAKVASSPEPIQEGIKISILGNIIDYGVSQNFSKEIEIEEIDKKKFALFDYLDFKQALENTEWILFIGDNAGECVFDKILIEVLGKPTYYVVRNKPIINDVTFKDALEAGIDKVAQIIDSGCDLPGISFKNADRKFLSLFKDAKLIISKGQGNFETLSDVRKEIFFLLQVKCRVVAKILSTEVGDFVLALSSNLKIKY